MKHIMFFDVQNGQLSYLLQCLHSMYTVYFVYSVCDTFSAAFIFNIPEADSLTHIFRVWMYNVIYLHQKHTKNLCVSAYTKPIHHMMGVEFHLLTLNPSTMDVECH